MREERKWGWRSEKDEEGVGIKRHPSNFSVNLITYSCDGVVIIYYGVQPVVLHITVILIILMRHKSKYSHFLNYLLECSLWSVG